MPQASPRIMALSRAQKSDILRLFGVPEEMVEVVGAGCNQSLFYPEAKSSPNLVDIVYVGKLSRAKGVPWLLKALARLLRQPWLLHLVGGGTGAEKEEVLALARPLGTRVVIHGPLHQETWPLSCVKPTWRCSLPFSRGSPW